MKHHTTKHHLLLLILSLLLAIPMAAQRPHNGNVQARFFEATASEMCSKLLLTPEQKEKFLPLYKAYDEEMRAVWTKYRVEKGCTNSMERTKMRLTRQAKLQELRLQYVDKFSNVLTAEQVEKLYKVENDIQQRAKQRKEHRKDGNTGGPHRNGQRSSTY